ncbi:hypothetical protein DH2020_021210 [Rehmannia glutinosa]|uniref:Uncharacterized protein n=1 Tax=Rehmannia glutinosa TaxID=99300 RepID=A0ABR0WE38_REHGL
MAGKEKKGVNEYGDGFSWIRGPILGKEGFGHVYLATLKNRISKYSCSPLVMAVKSAEVSVSTTLQNEMEIMRNLNVCPYVINCFGEETTMGENGVMAYNLLLEYGYEVRAHTRSILRGLNHVHGIGYVHCDLKPHNILLVPNSGRAGKTEFRAKIGDFGLAKRVKQSRKRKLEESYWRGTHMYLSPEAVIDSVQEAPSDVWAVGCIVLEMLTGKPVWDGEKAEDILAMIGAGNELPKIPNEISKEARDFLKRCFVRKSMYRFTCEMLLNHPFVQGLDSDDDDDDELESTSEYLNDTEPMAPVFESDDEFSSDSFSEDSFSHWSEEGSNYSMDDEPLGFAGACDKEEKRVKMIEVVLNDRLGKKVRVKCNDDDTIGDLKKLVAAQTGTRADKIRIQKWYTIYKDHITLKDYEIHDGMGLELYYN